MIKIKNTVNQYGMIAVLTHWVMALLILVLIGLGLYMTTLPDAGFTTKKIFLILLHKELGFWALIGVTLRLIWRWYNVEPQLPDNTPEWQKLASKLNHLSLYFLMFALPISGWWMSSAGGFPMYFLGFHLPDITYYNYNTFLQYKLIHKLLSYLLILLTLGHITAALEHHFFEKNNVLRKIIFFWKDIK